jgi:hypothetical protein
MEAPLIANMNDNPVFPGVYARTAVEAVHPVELI